MSTLSLRAEAYRRRCNARYKVLRLLKVSPTEAAAESHGSSRFRDKLEALGVDPRRYMDLCVDMRRSSHWERLRATYGMPRYVRPIRIERIVARPRPPVHPELGELRGPLRSVLVAAGVVRSEDGNTP